MKIEYIHKAELEDYAVQAVNSFEGAIPVSPVRAKSQAANPYARDEDVLLIVAREGSRLLSFLGILPGIVGGDPEKRIFWNTGWWAADDCPVAIRIALLREFQRIYGNQIAFSDLGDSTVEIIHSLGIKTIERKGIHIRFRNSWHQRSFARSLKGKFSGWISIFRSSGIFRLMDLFIRRRKPLHLADPSLRTELKISDGTPGEEELKFISSHSAYSIAKLTGEHIQWIVDNPWLITPDKEKVMLYKRYDFSSFSFDFQYCFPTLYFENRILGMAMLSIRDGVVKTLYIWTEEESGELFLNELCRFFQEDKNIHNLITADPQLVAFIDRNLLKINCIKRYKRYSGTGNADYGDLKIKDGDGDYSFW